MGEACVRRLDPGQRAVGKKVVEWNGSSWSLTNGCTKDIHSRQDRPTSSFIEGALSSSIAQGAYHAAVIGRTALAQVQSLFRGFCRTVPSCSTPNGSGRGTVRLLAELNNSAAFARTAFEFQQTQN
jgi:hypothetical protein